MTDNVSGGLPGRGKTFLSGSGRTIADTMSTTIEGTVRTFDDVAPGQGSGVKTKRSNRQTVCQLVRNVSGITLEAKRPVTWKAGYRGKRVDGYCDVAAEECAGVVDDLISASGVPNNDLFWVVQKGPCLVKTSLAGDGTNVITEGDVLVAMVAATSQATTAGRVQSWGLTATSTGTTDGTATRHLLNHIGRAMSAKTTGNTNADVLVDLAILK